jgi:predicted phosphodiesterase
MTLVFYGDSHTLQNGTKKLSTQLDKTISLSPTGTVDALFVIGDMETASKFNSTYLNSNMNDIPVYYTPGNHDVDNGRYPSGISDIKKYNSNNNAYPKNPGPNGTEKTTFSVDIKDIHVVILNIYWDGKTNEAWMKGGDGGGEVVPKLLEWLKSDLQAATTKYKIVLMHEPMYPDTRHIGDSLDWNKPARDKLQKLLNDYGVDIAFGGHTHYHNVEKHDNVLQVELGVSGDKAGNNSDSFQSMSYVNIASNGDLVLTHKQTVSGSWNNPIVKIWKLPQGNTQLKKYKCIDNTCKEDPSGTFITNNCDNKCNPQPSELKTINLMGCKNQPKRIGDKCTLTPLCKNNLDETIGCPSLTYTSNDSSVATVEEIKNEGKVTTLSIGSCNITAEYNNITSNSVPFTVIESDQPQSLENNSGLITLGLAAAISYYYYNKKKN